MSHFMRAEVSASGHVIPTRTLTSRVEAPCLTCRATISVGTVVWWGAHVGIWHITCDNPKAQAPDDLPKVEYPPDCGKCGKPVVDPVPPPAGGGSEQWCRVCADEWATFIAGCRERQREWESKQRPEKPEPDTTPASIGGEGYGF